MKAKGVKGILFILSFVALIMTSIFVSVTSASTIDRTYTKEGGVITCDTHIEKSVEDEVEEAKNPIFVIYKGEKIKFRNSSSSSEMKEL